MRRDLGRLLDGLGAGYVDDLNDGNPGQSILQIAMRADGEMIADLDRIRPAEALLLDDVGERSAAKSAGMSRWRVGRSRQFLRSAHR